MSCFSHALADFARLFQTMAAGTFPSAASGQVSNPWTSTLRLESSQAPPSPRLHSALLPAARSRRAQSSSMVTTFICSLRGTSVAAGRAVHITSVLDGRAGKLCDFMTNFTMMTVGISQSPTPVAQQVGLSINPVLH